MTDLAKKLAAHPKFRWTPGMRANKDTTLGWWEIVGNTDNKSGQPWFPTDEEDAADWYPSLTSSGVVGGLIMLLDDVCDETWTLTRHPKGWVVTGHLYALKPGPLHKMAGEALATALLDVWGR